MYLDPYLHGECYAMAVALHEGLGWPLVGIWRNSVVDHAGVRRPDGAIHDIRGAVTESEFTQPFKRIQSYVVCDIVLEDLASKCGKTDVAWRLSIDRARRVAEALWPELPWQDSLASRLVAFADELEALSRKHRFWLRGPVPAMSPVVADSQNDEGGYLLEPMADGATHMISRYFAKG